uniref:Sugar transferase n=1 Tax=candidate division WOR-3 bacterium TaxID=2052148 RepID=A0A7C3N937_UNCW3
MFYKKKINSEKIYIVIFDLLITVFSFWFSFYLRSLIIWKGEEFHYNPQYYNIVFLFILVVWYFLYSKTNEEDVFKGIYFRKEIFEVVVNNFYGTLFLFTFIFLIKGFIISRVFIVIFILLNTSLLLFERRILYNYRLKKVREGKNVFKIVLIGDSNYFEKMKDLIDKNTDWGIKIIKILKIEDFGKDILNELKSMHVDGLFISSEKERLENFNEQITNIVESGIKVYLNIDPLFKPKKFFLYIEKFKEFNFIEMTTLKRDVYQKLQLKYLLDKIFAFLFLILLSPIFLIVSIVILLLYGKPIFFVQERVGINGEIFKIIKFRTMEKDAEEKKVLLKEKNQMNGPVFKIERDPRITPFGRFLRKYSIDELPQLINILKGEMSFVGPRPPLPSEVKEYDFWHRRRLSFKPGLTCLWQISGRNNIDFVDWMKKDLEYIDNWSLLYDFIIILKTIPEVLKGNGW